MMRQGYQHRRDRGSEEWFDDVDASRTGKHANYGAITTGVNFMSTRWLNFRPEVRC